MGARPPVKLSPGQRTGVEVDPPVVYRQTRGAPHGPYSLTTDACATCHSTHRAASSMLLNQAAPQSELCFTCHGGNGATSNIAAQYSDPGVPANNPGTGSYYSHEATVVSGHVSDQGSDEFGGVLNRHAACADCHQPHRADGTLAVETTQGWTASGALLGASGVSVVNGAAGDAPTYTRTATSAFEYQLCFKCHSGYTILNPQTGPPSTWALDKAVELNPANLSYHPVEAPGTNQTAQMDVGLSGDPVYGSSPYKLWQFTSDSTIRCVSCHGDSRLGTPGSPPDAGARLAPHAVANRGMLIENLRDRTLKGASEAYQASDFALCYVCHGEYPFVDTTMDPLPSTNFPLHGRHTAAIASFSGPGGTIDDDGAGHGNALCAECHFRTHGTTYAVDGQAPASRLVNFAPNVQPYLGTLEWNAAGGTCTLTCHGVPHAAWSY
jgi:predicted CXXCH cytochrome family protein